PCDLSYKRDDIFPCGIDVIIVRIQSGDIQQLVNELQQAPGVAVHFGDERDQLFAAAAMDHVFQRTDDERERRAEFVRNVSKKTRLQMIQLFLLEETFSDIGKAPEHDPVEQSDHPKIGYDQNEETYFIEGG